MNLTTTSKGVHPRGLILRPDAVRAFLAGATQYRMPVKPQPPDGVPIDCRLYCPAVEGRDGMIQPGPEVFGFADEDQGWVCPFGAPDDRVYVKEVWMPVDPSFKTPVGFQWKTDPHGKRHAIVYGIDGYFCDWNPASTMPACAARIWLDVVRVRVEQIDGLSTWVGTFRRVEEAELARPTPASRGSRDAAGGQR